MEPLVSIVTPFHNTQDYLEECIESVLAQTYQNWEYILVNNRSTDRSAEIAERYARRDERIHLFHNERFLTQVQNYNHALGKISPKSKYCKIVQADDWIFPECITKMVNVAEMRATIGIVSSYRIEGQFLGNTRFPYSSVIMKGRDLCRLQLMNDKVFFGSPTTILFRSEIVRERSPFYHEGRYFEDTEACYEILETWDFGFVHQVLSFSRKDNESLTSSFRSFDPSFLLDKFINVHRYGSKFLTPEEYKVTMNRLTGLYFGYLAENFLKGRKKDFWEHHRKGLATIGYKLRYSRLAKYILWEIADIIFNPKKSVGRILKAGKDS